MNSNSICTKMPPLIKIEKFNNNWDQYLDYIYDLYIEDFFNNTLFYKGLPVKTFTNLEYNGKQETFNHITTKGSRDRLYNSLRCERYKWIKTMLEGETCENCESMAIWPVKKGKKHRTLIWCRKTNFLIVLEKRKNAFYLITAYCVIYPNTERDLRQSYNRYLTKNRSRLSER